METDTGNEMKSDGRPDVNFQQDKQARTRIHHLKEMQGYIYILFGKILYTSMTIYGQQGKQIIPLENMKRKGKGGG